MTGTTTCRPDAPRLLASDIVARRRREARTAISASVATRDQRRPERHDRDDPLRRRPARAVRLEDRRQPVRSAVSIEGVTLADG